MTLIQAVIIMEINYDLNNIYESVNNHTVIY